MSKFDNVDTDKLLKLLEQGQRNLAIKLVRQDLLDVTQSPSSITTYVGLKEATQFVDRLFRYPTASRENIIKEKRRSSRQADQWEEVADHDWIDQCYEIADADDQEESIDQCQNDQAVAEREAQRYVAEEQRYKAAQCLRLYRVMSERKIDCFYVASNPDFASIIDEDNAATEYHLIDKTYIQVYRDTGKIFKQCVTIELEDKNDAEFWTFSIDKARKRREELDCFTKPWAYRSKRVINLTGHFIIIVGAGWKVKYPMSTVCRQSDGTWYREPLIETETQQVGEMSLDVPGNAHAVPIFHQRRDGVRGLPEPRKDHLYIVSEAVRLLVPHRHDVMSVAGKVIDCDGKKLGYKGFIVN